MSTQLNGEYKEEYSFVSDTEQLIMNDLKYIDEFKIFSTFPHGPERYFYIDSIHIEYEYAEFELVENISNLNYDINNNDIDFNYNLPKDEYFSHLELHQDGSLLADNIETNTFKVTNLDYDTKYQFTFYSVDIFGNKSSGVTRSISIPENPNLLPSGDIFNLNHTVTDTSVNFNYNLPTDDRFSHIRVYRDNELLTDNYNLSEYTDRNLQPETEYHYRFVTVNKEGISSNGYSLTVKTNEEKDDTPPEAPTGLQINEMNAGLMLSWHSNTETDLNGYNVYINGERLNSSLIRSNSFNITNLENGTEYTIAVSAVDYSSNESELSSIHTGIPDEKEMPIFQLDTNLSAIGLSVENWFSEIWLLVAFATAIPLSFIIAGRVKSLFIA